MGVPVRYHDLLELKDRSNFDFLEFHLSYKDLEEDESKYFEEALDMDLIVHSPELFENDHLLDLSSPDDDYRQTSIEHLARVVELTRRLSLWFTRSTRPGIVVNVGGSSQNSLLTLHERDARYQTVAKSLDQLDPEGVEILVQTMPPFPWNFGGQRFHNLFVDPQEIADFCMQYGTRVCFDTSHSKQACTNNHWSFSEFVSIVGPHVGHLHIGDASGVDGEGLQILDGDIDWRMLSRELQDLAPDASFIPEIWQGHKNGGEGGWRALDQLEALFARAAAAAIISRGDSSPRRSRSTAAVAVSFVKSVILRAILYSLANLKAASPSVVSGCSKFESISVGTK